MEPSRDSLGHRLHGSLRSSSNQPSGAAAVSSSAAGVRRLTSDESWIEVSSQPSSSSLSSATNDEIITAGLRVTQSMNNRRRRRLHRSQSEQVPNQAQSDSITGSSQDGYEESESDPDHVMASSNETGARFRQEENGAHSNGLTLHTLSSSADAHSTASDDDENATALGVANPSPIFTPQPNAFTHPPAARVVYQSDQESYFAHSQSTNRFSQASPSTPPTSQSTGGRNFSRAHTRTRSHTPYTMMAPNHSVPIDHDAALRASLSTLLSCAAAARGLPKRESIQSSTNYTSTSSVPTRPLVSNRIEQGTLRLIPESALNATDSSAHSPLLRRTSQRSSSDDLPPQAKRKSKSPSHDRRKKRQAITQAGNEELRYVSPTLMTWIAGVGVVVLFSAISFSAGYALGKDVGRFESAAGDLNYGVSEAEGTLSHGLRGRGWRWGNAGSVRA